MIDFHFITDRGNSAQRSEDQASHCNGLVTGKAKAKEFIHFVYTYTPCQLDATVWSLQNLWFCFIAFVRQIPKNLFQYVCKCHKPYRASVFVYDNRHLLA